MLQLSLRTELLHRRGDEHLEEVQTLCGGQLEQV